MKAKLRDVGLFVSAMAALFALAVLCLWADVLSWQRRTKMEEFRKCFVWITMVSVFFLALDFWLNFLPLQPWLWLALIAFGAVLIAGFTQIIIWVFKLFNLEVEDGPPVMVKI